MSGSVPIIPDRPRGGWSGWHYYMTHYPVGFEMVEVWRYGWTETSIVYVGRDPAMNVAGLWWRPVANGREAIN